jgi:hypothetical protein
MRFTSARRGGSLVEFRLVYDGRLPSASNRSRVKEKHDIRKAVHKQLVQLVEIRKMVEDRHTIMSKRIKVSGFSFVPLVTKEHAVFCEIDILFLRSGPPGSVTIGGDLDNRLKVLFDALRVPHHENELPKNVTPAEDEQERFRCLLEDDSLITGHTVTTDRLLLPSADDSQVRLILHVRIEPMIRGTGNVGF